MMTATNSVFPAHSALDLADIGISMSAWVRSHNAQIVQSALLAAAIIAILHVIKLIGQRLCKSPRFEGHWPMIIGRALSRTRLWFMVAVAAKLIAVLAQAPAEIAFPIQLLFVAAVVFQGAIWIRTLILGGVQLRAAEADPNGSLSSAVGLIRLLVTVVLAIIATILVLANLGVNVTGLLAGLGIGGIAIGLAAQGIFSDLFAALSILFDKPFRKGDIIRWDTTVGTVEAIGLKTSRIRAVTGEEVIISNANLLGKELRNFARLERRRIIQTLSLVYQTPPETCATLPTILEAALDDVDKCNFIRCGLQAFAASSLDFTVHFDVLAERQEDVIGLVNDANLAILKAMNAHQIGFAYPTQTTFTAAPDGSMVMPWAPPVQPAVAAEKKRRA